MQQKWCNQQTKATSRNSKSVHVHSQAVVELGIIMGTWFVILHMEAEVVHVKYSKIRTKHSVWCRLVKINSNLSKNSNIARGREIDQNGSRFSSLKQIDLLTPPECRWLISIRPSMADHNLHYFFCNKSSTHSGCN